MKILTPTIVLPLVMALSIDSFARSPEERKSEAIPFEARSNPGMFVHMHPVSNANGVPQGYLLKRLQLGEQVPYSQRQDMSELFEKHVHTSYVHTHLNTADSDAPNGYLLKRIMLGEQVPFSNNISEEEKFVKHVHQLHGEPAAGTREAEGGIKE